MPLNRRDFMKIFGVSVASLFLARCRLQSAAPTEDVQPTCYEPTAPPMTAVPSATAVLSTRERLRLYWLRFGELGQNSLNDTENKLGQELVAGHRSLRAGLDLPGRLQGGGGGMLRLSRGGGAIFEAGSSEEGIRDRGSQRLRDSKITSG